MASLTNPRDLWTMLKGAGNSFIDDKAPRLGAALAYYTIFSLAPLLVIVLSVAGLIFHDKKKASGLIQEQVQDLVGEDGGKAVEQMVASADQPQTGKLATVLGVGMLLFGATVLFGQLQDALNTIWGVQPKPDRGLIAGIVRDRLLSFTMVLGTAFLLLMSLVVSAALSAMGRMFGEWGMSVAGQAVNLIVSVLVITVLFAMIYRFLPDAKIAWKDVWFGAFVTAVLFTAGKFLIGLYLGKAGTASSYGAAGSLAVLLIWLYYSSQIFLFGAELTKSYANLFGSRIVPKDYAEPVTAEARAQQGIPTPAHAGS
jgi:membrane protein